MKVALYTNINKDKNLKYTNSLINYLQNKDCEIIKNDIWNSADFIIVLGGDGTMLRAAKMSNSPILGINLGNLGYLTDVSIDSAFKSIDKIFENKFLTEKRMMLRCDVLNKSYIALNDIVIYRGLSPRLIKSTIHINGEFMAKIRADGIIISSPTGSTAYNLSSNGPILKPDAQMIVITPISPHSLSSRPAVISHTDEISIDFDNSEGFSIALDGEAIPMDSTKKRIELKIKKDKKIANIIKTNHLSFYEILRKKMNRDN